jgi:hypothetical protein
MYSLTKKLFSSITTPNLPIKILEESKNAANFIKLNKFTPDIKQFTIKNLYGIHRDDIDLIVMYTENDKTHTIWKFINSNYIPKTAFFVNEDGQIRLFDFTDPDELKRFTKMNVVK